MEPTTHLFLRLVVGCWFIINLMNCHQPESISLVDKTNIDTAQTSQYGEIWCCILPIEQQPEFPGGATALTAFIGQNICYPQGQVCVSGRVFVSFVIETDGRISGVSVVRGLGSGYDQEAIRVMQTMPAWKPGKQSGRPVRVRYNLPISFTLE